MNDPEALVTGPLAEKIHHYLERITPFGFSGAVLVARDNNIILNAGYGQADRARATPNRPNTVFNLGSITKQFTATAILKLEAMRRLRVHDSISHHLSGVPADKEAITLHHLLTHTLGLIADPSLLWVAVKNVSHCRLRSCWYNLPGKRVEVAAVGGALYPPCGH